VRGAAMGKAGATVRISPLGNTMGDRSMVGVGSSFMRDFRSVMCPRILRNTRVKHTTFA